MNAQNIRMVCFAAGLEWEGVVAQNLVASQ